MPPPCESATIAAMATSVRDHRLPLVRLLHRPLDLAEYFEAVELALGRLLPFDAACWLSLDPGTWLPTSHVSRLHGSSYFMALVANEYLEEDVNKFAPLAVAARPVGLMSAATGGDLGGSARYAGILAPLGYAGDEMRAVFRDGDAAWGGVALHRRQGMFEEREAELVADVGALVATGIRRAILRTAVTADRGPEPPGLIVLRGDDSIEDLTPAAGRLLAEVFDSTVGSGPVPLTVASIAQQARRSIDPGTDEIAGVRLPTRRGGWVRMDASLMDDDPRGRVAVIVSAAREPEIATLVAQAYGLSAREREVTGFVLRGASTQEIAAALHVTPYTVQDHLKAIFEKVGVRSRRELVAQLFMQQCATEARGRRSAWCRWLVRLTRQPRRCASSQLSVGRPGARAVADHDPVSLPPHPRVVGRVGVHARATVVDGRAAPFVVPGLVAVDLAQAVPGPVLGQPRRGRDRSQVHGISRDVRRCLRGGDPPSRFLDGPVRRDRLAKEPILVRGGAPATLDDEFDLVIRGIRRSSAQRVEEIGIETGDARDTRRRTPSRHPGAHRPPRQGAHVARAVTTALAGTTTPTVAATWRGQQRIQDEGAAEDADGRHGWARAAVMAATTTRRPAMRMVGPRRVARLVGSRFVTRPSQATVALAGRIGISIRRR